MDKNVAAGIVALMRDYSDKLNVSIQTVKDTCTKQEFLDYRKAAARIMGEMHIEILRPIFKEHPELEPEEWKPKK